MDITVTIPDRVDVAITTERLLITAGQTRVVIERAQEGDEYRTRALFDLNAVIDVPHSRRTNSDLQDATTAAVDYATRLEQARIAHESLVAGLDKVIGSRGVQAHMLGNTIRDEG